MKAKDLIKILKKYPNHEILIDDIYTGCDTSCYILGDVIEASKGEKASENGFPKTGDNIKKCIYVKNSLILKSRAFV